MSYCWRDELTAVMAGASRIVFFGVGNESKGDDGAGPACAARLRSRLPAASGGRVLVVDGRETPENQTGIIRRFSPDLTLLIDAAVGGHPPGTVFVAERDKIADEGVSTHTLSLLYLIRYLEESIGSRVVVLGIEPKVIHQGAPISDVVSAAIGEIVDFLSRHFCE